MAKIQFTVVLESAEPKWPGGVFFTLPQRAGAKLGTRARVSVVGTLNGYPFRSSAFPTGDGTHYMAVNKEMRQGAGVGIGDRVRVTLEVDTTPRTVTLPPDLRKALSKSKNT